MEEGWEESDESVNVPPLECLKADLSLTSSEEVDNWVCAAVVFGEPFFADHGSETGSEAGGEASKPKAVDRDRETCGLEGDGWVGYVCQAWVTTVQQLVKEQGRLLLVVWFQVIEGSDEEGGDNGGEQGGL